MYENLLTDNDENSIISAKSVTGFFRRLLSQNQNYHLWRQKKVVENRPA